MRHTGSTLPENTEEEEEDAEVMNSSVSQLHLDMSVPVDSVPVCCLSFRQPFAGLVLDGVKTVESRWRPLLALMQNQTLGIHIARRDWEGEEWRAVLSGPLGMNRAQIDALLESGERFGRGVVAGLVDVGPTWLCPAHLSEAELRPLERSAVLIGLEQKHLTHLSNPRWLTQPISSRGDRDLWTVEIPAELLP
ncbi:protein EOLA1 [Scomber scombrus]|uniref:Protein EOLA1 n=1 Tax=Scomber scombrus TaxID=13677 RepID=A0AAV1QB41_SCOSC